MPLADRLFGLTGKVAWVTGAAAGIGREIAVHLHGLGASVAVVDRDADAARDLASALGERALHAACDVSSEEQVLAAVARTREELGPVDVLVNSAGITSGPGLPFTNNTEADWDRVWAVNVKAMFFTAKALADDLKASCQGRVVNISSITGVISAAYMPAYSVSKAAILSLTKVLARDLAPHGVTVNAVCPGFVWTPLWQSLGAQMARHSAGEQGSDARAVFDNRVKALVPMGTAQTVEDVAAAVAFFCSPAAGQVTGQWLGVDGGVTI